MSCPQDAKLFKPQFYQEKTATEAYDLIRREVVQGRQAYVVLPLIEESEKIDLKSAIEEYQRLQDVIYPEFKVGLLHGRMTSAEKRKRLTNFATKKPNFSLNHSSRSGGGCAQLYGDVN
jgi:ATP-dependent DNA helicase RecG